MKHEVKKISKIIDELVTFCLLHGTNSMNISIENSEEYFKISISGDSIDCKDKRVKKLKQLLSGPRQTEIEEYYWELAGENDRDTELCLVGAMIDKAEVNYDEKDLSITLYRYK
ncbi:MAG: hypothetical protein FH761_18030 [Firmicutes bacterium]|nr:hypothetical protein [Bacillota bacterium]